MSSIRVHKSFFNRLFSKTKLGRIALLLSLFLIFGFPITTAIPILLQIPSTPVNIAFRFLYLLASFYLILGSTISKNPRTRAISLGGWFLIGFWLVYSIRLIHDVSFQGIVFKGSAFYTYSFAFGSCLIPMIAVLLTGKNIKHSYILPGITTILLISNLAIIFLVIFFAGTLSPEILMARVALSTNLEEGASELAINPITISLFGQLLALLSLSKLLISAKKGAFHTFMNIVLFMLGLANLILGASRGPMLSFMVLVFPIVFYHLHEAKKTKLYITKVLLFLLILMSSIYYFVVPLITSNKLAAIGRIQEMIETGGTTKLDTRPLAWAGAWQQFLDRPIVGDCFLGRFDNFYPHNIYLEVLMSTGVLGGIFFFSFCVLFFGRYIMLYFKFDFPYFVVVLFTTSYFLSGLTSASLFSNPKLWMLLGLTFSIIIKSKLSLGSNKIIHTIA